MIPTYICLIYIDTPYSRTNSYVCRQRIEVHVSPRSSLLLDHRHPYGSSVSNQRFTTRVHFLSFLATSYQLRLHPRAFYIVPELGIPSWVFCYPRTVFLCLRLHFLDGCRFRPVGLLFYLSHYLIFYFVLGVQLWLYLFTLCFLLKQYYLKNDYLHLPYYSYLLMVIDLWYHY